MATGSPLRQIWWSAPTSAGSGMSKDIMRKIFDPFFTLQDLALRLGMSHQQLQKYETGSNRVSAGVLYHVAHALSVPVDALFEAVDDTTGLDEAMKTLQLARNKCHAIVNRASSVPVLDSMAKVLRTLRDKD